MKILHIETHNEYIIDQATDEDRLHKKKTEWIHCKHTASRYIFSESILKSNNENPGNTMAHTCRILFFLPRATRNGPISQITRNLSHRIPLLWQFIPSKRTAIFRHTPHPISSTNPCCSPNHINISRRIELVRPIPCDGTRTMPSCPRRPGARTHAYLYLPTAARGNYNISYAERGWAWPPTLRATETTRPSACISSNVPRLRAPTVNPIVLSRAAMHTRQ